MNVRSLILWVGLSLAVGNAPILLGGFPSEWYAALDKPPWTPPAWLFGPVWTVLYILMGVAAALVAERPRARPALTAFVGQLGLNALWFVLFFLLRRPTWALAEVIVLWGAIFGTAVWFWKKRPVAGLLLLPYLAWVSFAVALNATIVARN